MSVINKYIVVYRIDGVSAGKHHTALVVGYSLEDVLTYCRFYFKIDINSNVTIVDVQPFSGGEEKDYEVLSRHW